MGFRQDAYARIWSVNDEGRYSTANISVSRKNKDSGAYEIEFSDGYVRLVGAAHEAAKNLGLPTREEFDAKNHKGVSVKIASCDVTNHYDSKSKKLFTNCVIFEFELPESNSSSSGNKANNSNKSKTKTAQKTTAEDYFEDDLPF